VGKTPDIDLPGGARIKILYEDRSVLAIDKPPGWILAPDSWEHTRRNLQAVLAGSVRAREHWARVRNLRFIRFVHRLDAETSGIVLLARSPGAVAAYTRLFASRQIRKSYLAVVEGRVREQEWICRFPIAPDPAKKGRMIQDPKSGRDAETAFRLLEARDSRSLVEARPLTGRTHQVRVHLAWSGHAVLGDQLYGTGKEHAPGLALRAVGLEYTDPFSRRKVTIQADRAEFLDQYWQSATDSERDKF
jgi:23S rRNA pseudouridine1911/1915/1917 synthase